ncbi:hypothetical protein AB0G32_29030 [Streptomyces sp. NPDC023723]|uniref:hypothetical protein n=1 Tax=Streptomyces sp. NPDC023723 TaxID=3154323 RepID=UPI0033EA40D6
MLDVRPCTLDESARVLVKRAPEIGADFIPLAHALAGGVHRDLIRYGRRLMEIKAEDSEVVELAAVARVLIVEELAATLEGFRTLLAEQEWRGESVTVLLSFRTVTGCLPPLAATRCRHGTGRLTEALTQLAAQDGADLTEEAGRLLEEATAYVYFCLTLLQIFGPPDFGDRRASAARRAPRRARAGPPGTRHVAAQRTRRDRRDPPRLGAAARRRPDVPPAGRGPAAVRRPVRRARPALSPGRARITRRAPPRPAAARRCTRPPAPARTRR